MVILTKLVSKIDPETHKTTITQKYLHGAFDSDAHTAVPLPAGLKKGTYLLMYQAMFTEAHAERKLVVSAYCNKKVKLERVSVNDYDPNNFAEFTYVVQEA